MRVFFYLSDRVPFEEFTAESVADSDGARVFRIDKSDETRLLSIPRKAIQTIGLSTDAGIDYAFKFIRRGELDTMELGVSRRVA